jgi:hypothetical protein
MEERKELLKQLGWSEELIEKIYSPEYIPMTESMDSYFLVTPSETSSTSLSLVMWNPIISGGVRLPK